MNYKFNLTNPLLIYISIWLLTLFLHSLKATTNIVSLNSETLILVFSNIATFIIIYVVLNHYYPTPTPQPNINKNSLIALSGFTKKLLYIWLIGTIIEIIVSGGVPIVWQLMHSSKNYTNFGIASFHGIMNSIYLFSITALFLDYKNCKNKTSLWLMISLLFWPIIMIERGILLGALLQIVCIHFFTKKIDFSKLLKLFGLAFLVIILFGVIGNFRVSFNPYLSMVSNHYKQVFHILPGGFLWVYVYITSPINNIAINIQHLHPSYTFFYSIINSVPTIIREHFISNSQANPMYLPIAALNVSTFYAGFLADFGIAGAIAIVAALQIFIASIYIAARRIELAPMIIYSILFQCIIFSVFFNLFFLPVYIFQGMLVIFFNIYQKRTLLQFAP